MTRYNKFTEIEVFMASISVMEQTGELSYNKMIPSGELAKHHNDYGVGFYDVSMYYMKSYQNTHNIRVWFGTIDDGDFGGWATTETKEEAILLLEEVKNVFSKMTSCPSPDDLNEMFRELGVYFSF